MPGPVAIIERAATPYRPAIFDSVGQQRAVTVFYYLEDGSKGRWRRDSAGGGDNFEEKHVFSFSVGPFVICPTLPYELYKGGFEEVVGTSDTDVVPTMLLILPYILIAGVHLTIWTEEIDTKYRYDQPKQQSLLIHLLAVLFWKVTRIGQRIEYSMSSRILAYSDLAAKTALERGAASSKIETRPQAIDPSILSEPDPTFNPPSGSPTVLFLGTVGKRKGIDTLIKSLEYLPNSAKLWIAGDGPERSTIESEMMPDERIEIFGRVSDPEKSSLLEQADILALPSRHEPWGIVVLEALAHGTPVVTSSAAGVEMILDERSVVEPENPEKLAVAIQNSVDISPPDPPEIDEMAEPLFSIG